MSSLSLRIPTNTYSPSLTKRRASLRTLYPSLLPVKCALSVEDEVWHTRGLPTSIPLLREAINTLDTKMATLMTRRHELEAHLDQAVRSQSPLTRLPSEILSSIFIFGVFGVDDDNPVMVPTLMLVCHFWLQVALNTPTLWAKISISRHDSPEKARRNLERSKSCPIDVFVNFGPRLEYSSTITEHVIRAMDLIQPAIWRIRSFSLCVSNRHQAHAALMYCQGNAPLLETLSIRVHHAIQDDSFSSAPLPLFNGHTPRLHSCSLTSFHFGWDQRLVSHLRVLKLGGYFNSSSPSPSVLFAILRQCPDLEELALRNLSSVDGDACMQSDEVESVAFSQKITLQKLVKLSFYYSGIGLTRRLMNQIAFPNLESLDLCYLENITPLLHILHTQALTRLPLRYLRIETCLFNEIKFLNVLRQLPSLVSLDLIDLDDVSSGLLKTLSFSQPWICPQLVTLSLDGCTALEWDSLRTFVESRVPVHHSVPCHPPYYPLVSQSPPSFALARTNDRIALSPRPHRLRSINVTRCTQISREMVQWLRMYVPDVKCESAKGVWGEIP